MSWIKENYEKAALGTSIAIAVGFCIFGFNKTSQVNEDFVADTSGNGKSNANIDATNTTKNSLATYALPREWSVMKLSDRVANLLTGVPLFVKNDDLNVAIDLYEDKNVHESIPNSWFLNNGLDLGFADAPQQDEDKDGFTNVQEFKAETDPTSFKSHPPLIGKLTYIQPKTLTWYIRPGFNTPDGHTFSYGDSTGATNRTPAAEPTKEGNLFFANGAMKNRFKYLGLETARELNKRINQEMDVTYVKIEDQKPNKKGTIYKIAPFSQDRALQNAYYDRTAILILNAIGYESQPFQVEENTSFSLPPGGSETNYRVTTITDTSITVEFQDSKNQKQSLQINRSNNL